MDRRPEDEAKKFLIAFGLGALVAWLVCFTVINIRVAATAAADGHAPPMHDLHPLNPELMASLQKLSEQLERESAEDQKTPPMRMREAEHAPLTELDPQCGSRELTANEILLACWLITIGIVGSGFVSGFVFYVILKSTTEFATPSSRRRTGGATATVTPKRKSKAKTDETSAETAVATTKEEPKEAAAPKQLRLCCSECGGATCAM